ncbi:MAG: PEGA domain-containing protein [Myxococcaceae bacterium]|jgi:hypothetical protein|nr:PEGA domain-containing protein [Myxococcaceae bacterium]MCA3011342.1 PEGA domain-containing protein [Myxococcaceae bacterium]
MAPAKLIPIGACALLGLLCLGVGVMGALSIPETGPLPPVNVTAVSLRALPEEGAPPAVSPTPRPGEAPTTGATDAGVVKPAAADAGTAPRPPSAPDAGALSKPPVAADAGAAPRPPATPKADAGAPAEPAREGTLNLRASETADVFVDGKKVGSAPVEGLKVKAGTHKVRFDCYDAAGNALLGAPKTVTVTADAEETVEFACPASE